MNLPYKTDILSCNGEKMYQLMRWIMTGESYK